MYNEYPTIEIPCAVTFDACPFALAKLGVLACNDSWLYGDVPEMPSPVFDLTEWIGETL